MLSLILQPLEDGNSCFFLLFFLVINLVLFSVVDHDYLHVGYLLTSCKITLYISKCYQVNVEQDILKW